MERQQLKNQEEWATRNIEDKMAIKARYKAEIKFNQNKGRNLDYNTASTE